MKRNQASKNSAFHQALTLFLALLLFAPAAVFAQAGSAAPAVDHAAGFGDAAGTEAVKVGANATDTVAEETHCVCMSQGCQPAFSFQHCVMQPLSTVAMIGSVAMMGMNFMKKDGVEGSKVPGFGGSGVPSFDPGKPLADQIGCEGTACSCSNPDVQTSILCDPTKLQNLPDDLRKNRATFSANPDLVPADKSLSEVLKNFDTAIGQAETLASGKIPTEGLGGIAGTNFSGDTAGTGNGKGGAGGKGYGVTEGNGSGGGFGSDYGASKAVAGPADRGGLGATIWNGKLDMIDDVTGRSLTIWQRATRRYQGIEGKRAFMLARTEGIRSNRFAVSRRAQTLPTAAKKLGVAAPKGAPAGRKPASIKRAHRP